MENVFSQMSAGSISHCVVPACGPPASWMSAGRLLVSVALMTAVLCGPVWGSDDQAPSGSENTDTESPTWWVRRGDRVIQGFPDGSRTLRQRRSQVTLPSIDESSITTSNGSRYQVSEVGALTLVRTSEPERVESIDDRPPKFAKVRLLWSKILAFASRLEIADVGGATLGLFVRVSAVILCLRVLLSWADVSYSYRSVARFSLVFVIMAELLQSWSGSLWAG